MNKTRSLKIAEINKDWYVANAEGKTLGRFASEVAKILRGKHKASFTPNIDMGDFVVVINASKIVVTGNRLDDKMYRRHTGYPCVLVEIPLRTMLDKHPDRVIRYAVKGMLPKTKLGRKMLTKLKVYGGDDHPHQAQQPRVYDY